MIMLAIHHTRHVFERVLRMWAMKRELFLIAKKVTVQVHHLALAAQIEMGLWKPRDCNVYIHGS